jgi:hypothetical protein
MPFSVDNTVVVVGPRWRLLRRRRRRTSPQWRSAIAARDGALPISRPALTRAGCGKSNCKDKERRGTPHERTQRMIAERLQTPRHCAGEPRANDRKLLQPRVKRRACTDAAVGTDTAAGAEASARQIPLRSDRRPNSPALAPGFFIKRRETCTANATLTPGASQGLRLPPARPSLMGLGRVKTLADRGRNLARLLTCEGRSARTML